MKHLVSCSTIVILICSSFMRPAFAEDLVQIRLQTTDLSAVPISSVPVGSEFLLHVTVEDLRGLPPDEGGVFSAYMDLVFDSVMLSVVESLTNPLGFEIEFGPDYPNGRKGSIDTPGLIDEVGAFDDIIPLGPGELTLFNLRFHADTVGTTTLASDPADKFDSEVLVFGLNLVVLPEQIIYGSTEITIVPEPSSLALAAFGFVGFLSFAYRRRRTA